jgi:hypothetical protein
LNFDFDGDCDCDWGCPLRTGRDAHAPAELAPELGPTYSARRGSMAAPNTKLIGTDHTTRRFVAVAVAVKVQVKDADQAMDGRH